MSKNQRFVELSHYFYDRLVNDTVPFWVRHAVDRTHGGYTFFLGRSGEILSPDKAMWTHGRVTWLFSKLYNDLEQRPEWLELAKHGADFIRAHGFDQNGRMYYSVTRDGKPLRQRRYVFTEVFGALGLAEYAKASRDREALELARRTLEVIRDYTLNEKLQPKMFPETRRTRGHSLAMIQIDMLQVLREADPERDYSRLMDERIDDVLTNFVRPDLQAVLEVIGREGELLLDLPEGRWMNPGHAIETAWFILEEARRRGDDALAARAYPIIDWALERGWDETYGGLLYFIDIEGKQQPSLEWDMKLWWPHNEAIYATLLAYHMSGQKRYYSWFERILAYSLAHFEDREHGEWIGYLHRDGSVSMHLKGNMWKGPFHLPRQQLYCHKLLKEMTAQ
ncbi:MAG: AGE family epimerase/isomerase [Alkalispirochaetaceae bacterium]